MNILLKMKENKNFIKTVFSSTIKKHYTLNTNPFTYFIISHSSRRIPLTLTKAVRIVHVQFSAAQDVNEQQSFRDI